MPGTLLACGIGTLLTLPGSSSTPAEEPAQDHWDLKVEQGVLYDDNAFRLSGHLRRRFDEGRASDQVSGRFDDMDSEDDVLLTTELELKGSFPGFGGAKELRVEPGIRFETWTQNRRKSHPEATLELRQEYSGGRSLGIVGEYRHDVFARNYLAGVTDPVGSVSSAERVYDAGVYRQWTTGLEAGQRLWRSHGDDAGILGVRRVDGTARLEVGQRSYDAPFGNRDRDILGVALDLDFAVGRHGTFSLGGEFERILTDDGREIMIRNEPDFGVDLNGDGDALDSSVGTLQAADRSRDSWGLEAGWEQEVARDWTVGLRAGRTWQAYRSHAPFDLAHRGRDDAVWSGRLQVEWAFRPRWTLTGTLGMTRETSNREDTPDIGDEDAAYRRNYAALVLGARF